MAGAGVIDDYVADLDVRLRGDRRTKADLLTEARDSLEDAAECYRGAGFAEHDAERRAIEEFGPAVVIAHSYQAELAAAYGARTLRAILFVLPVVNLLWEGTRLLWVGSWEEFGAAPPAWYMPFAQLNESMSWAVAVATALALLVGRMVSRHVADSRLIARCAAGVAVVAITASILATVALLIATAAFDVNRLFSEPACFLASMVAMAVMAGLAVMARRTALFCT